MVSSLLAGKELTSVKSKLKGLHYIECETNQETISSKMDNNEEFKNSKVYLVEYSTPPLELDSYPGARNVVDLNNIDQQEGVSRMQMDFIFIDAETKATHSYIPGKRKMKIKVTSFTNGAPGFEETLTCSKNIKLGK